MTEEENSHYFQILKRNSDPHSFILVGPRHLSFPGSLHLAFAPLQQQQRITLKEQEEPLAIALKEEGLKEDDERKDLIAPFTKEEYFTVLQISKQEEEEEEEVLTKVLKE